MISMTSLESKEKIIKCENLFEENIASLKKWKKFISMDEEE